MRNILTILKKELLRVFKDPKLILVVILLPGLLIFGLYSIMGNFMNNTGNEPLKVYTINMPAGGNFNAVLTSDLINADYEGILSSELDNYIAKLENKEIDLILVFDADFTDTVGQADLPKIQIHYNSAETKSLNGYQSILAALNSLQPEDFKISGQNVADEKAQTASIFAMMIPFILISLLFSGCMSVATDSIAGEKERGTMATLLKTPVKRREIAIGKISALSILAVISAISSFIGLMLSMPKLMGMSLSSIPYGAGEYVLMLLVVISTVLIIISVMSVISSFARTVKEANMLIMPFMLLSMVVGVTSMISSVAPTGFYFYLIPIYNSVQSLVAILTSSVNIVNLVVTIVSNIVYAGIFIFVLSKLFNKERIMFAK